MKKFLFASLLSVSLVYAEDLYLSPTQIEIYKDKSFLLSESKAKFLKKGSINIFIPGIKSFEDAIVSIGDLNCNILLEKENLVKNKKIKLLKTKIKSLKILFEAKLEESKAFQRINVNISNIDNVYRKYNKLLAEISLLKSKIKKLEDKLKSLEESTGKNFKLVYKCNKPAKSYIRSFSPINIFGYQEYSIYGFTDIKKLKIDNIITLENKTNISLKNISVKYHNFMKNSFIEPPPFFRPADRTYRRSIALAEAIPVSEYKETFSKSYFLVKNVYLPKKETIKLFISSDVYPADFSVYIDGYATVTPFLMAIFKADKNFPFSHGKFFIDGLFLGKGLVKAISKGKENSLFFGEDVLFDVRKEKVEDSFENVSEDTVKHTVKWKYVLKNNHKTGMQATIVDRLPKEVAMKKIKYMSDIPWEKHTADGKVVWKIFLKPNQELGFSFGYIETYKIK